MKRKVFRTHPILVIEGRLFSIILIFIPSFALFQYVKLMISEFSLVFFFATLFFASLEILSVWLLGIFWQLFWGKLIITETKIIWKCLFLKKKVMEISQIKFVCKRRFTRGNVVANKQRYNNSYAYILITTQNSLPDLNIEKIRTKDGLIKFTMSDKLVKCLRERVPRHACRL